MSLLNINIFETFNLSCLCNRGKKHRRKKTEDADLSHVIQAGHEYNIAVLPVAPAFKLSNLFPLTNHVERWNIMIVGSDKSYILASIGDPHVKLEGSKLLNQKGIDRLPKELSGFFEIVWSKTLAGQRLQFFMVWNSKTYLVNTYALYNQSDSVVAATMFMRAFTGNDSRMLELEQTNQRLAQDVESRLSGEGYGEGSSISSSHPPPHVTPRNSFDSEDGETWTKNSPP